MFARPKAHDESKAAEVMECHPGLAQSDLIGTIVGCSPYLASVFRKEHEWLCENLVVSPENVAQRAIAASKPATSDIFEPLRKAKQRASFLIAYHDLAGHWSVSQVTQALSDLADAALDHALARLLSEEAGKSGLAIATARTAGLVPLAMGKHGAKELNYSSDIDLIMLFDDSLHAPPTLPEIRHALIRVTKRLVKGFSEPTASGYVFRTDLRLRPDPSVTPVCMSMDAAERYYESLGRTWERAAMIKARAAAGAIEAGRAFLSRLSPFVWRRHLDFAAIQNAEDMLLNIRHHKGLTGPISVPGHDIKLGRGGIREIEFFVQTHQLIFGGRDPSLRNRRTLDTLQDLVSAGKIDADHAERLSGNYRYLRSLEHRLQMLDDAQTHVMPTSDEKLARLAAFCGFDTVDDLLRDVRTVLESTHAATDLPGHAGQKSPATRTDLDDDLDRMENVWATRPALRTGRARGLYRKIRPALLERFGRASDPKEALAQFDNFVRELPSGVQLFSLFDANPNLLELVVDICGSTPDLARYLSRNSNVLDVVLDSAFFQPLPDLNWYKDSLSASLVGVDDYETALDTVRIWQKEQHFRVGVHLLKHLSAAASIAAAYTSIAEASVSCILPIVETHIAGRLGTIEGGGVAVLAMGKLGSRDMTASSDLDLIVIYDAPPDARSNGKKEVPATTYYARLTQALITAMTAPTSQGRLYEVDMRLRPSGKQGPVATSVAAFEAYQRDSAWTWEHLALTRARCIAGAPDLKRTIETVIADILRLPHDRASVLRDVRDMLDKLGAAKSTEASAAWATKHGPGRLMAIELFLQAGTLVHGLPAAEPVADQIASLAAAGWMSKPDAEVLLRTWQQLSAVQRVTRLIGENTPIDGSKPAQADLLVACTGAADFGDLEQSIAENARAADQIITGYLQGAQSVANAQPEHSTGDAST